MLDFLTLFSILSLPHLFNPLYAEKDSDFFAFTLACLFFFIFAIIQGKILGLLDVTLSSLSNPLGPTTVLGVDFSSTQLVTGSRGGRDVTIVQKSKSNTVLFILLLPCLFVSVCVYCMSVRVACMFVRVPCPVLRRLFALYRFRCPLIRLDYMLLSKEEVYGPVIDLKNPRKLQHGFSITSDLYPSIIHMQTRGNKMPICFFILYVAMVICCKSSKKKIKRNL